MAKWIPLALGAIAAGAQAQQAPAPAQQLERVEITGSSIKRIEGETALPVQVLTREDIQRTGAANVEQLMQTVSAIASSGTLVAASASGATTGGISSISMRGLSSIRTLVLINGRRISPYGIGFTNDSVSVDVNSIPLVAVERVEILKDGASAIYGSDAIAGVVNFILRKDFRGAEATVEYGGTTDGGGKVQRVSGAYGYGDLATNRFNVMFIASYQKEDPIYGRNRKFAKSGVFPDVNNDVTSGNSFPANFVAADGSFGTRNPGYPNNCGPYSIVSPVFEANGLINRCRYDPSSQVALLPESERKSLFASARFALTNDLEGFVEASYNKNDIRTIIQPVPISDIFTIPLNNPLANQYPYNAYAGGVLTPTPIPYSTIVMTSANFYYPTAYVQAQSGGPTPDLLIRYRAIPSGNRDLTDTSESPRLTLGVKGTLASWDFDAAFLHSANKLTETINGGYPQLTKIMPLLNNNTGD